MTTTPSPEGPSTELISAGRAGMGCPLPRGHTPFAPMFNGNGLEEANEDESVEETYFRLIIESPYFDAMDSENREMFLLSLAQECISWVQDRNVF